MASPRLAAVAALALAAAVLAAYLVFLRAPGGGEECPVVRALLCAAAEKAWEEIIARFEEDTCIRVEPVYGSSGRLLAMLELGRRGDLYAPAAPEYMEKAVEKGLVDPSTVKPVAYLVPAIIVPKGNPANITSLEDLARPGVRVAIGEPESVAVGRYAVELLEYNGLYENVSRNIVVYAENFAKLMMLVAAGQVDAVIGWSIGHYWYPEETELIPIPPEKMPRTSYIPVAVTTYAEHPWAARKFIEYVTENPRALEVWHKYHYPTSPPTSKEKKS